VVCLAVVVSLRVVLSVSDTEQMKLVYVCKCVYSKAFDIDMSPSSFGADHLYHFISERFEGTSAPVQEQCLEWLQVSTVFLLTFCCIISHMNMCACWQDA